MLGGFTCTFVVVSRASQRQEKNLTCYLGYNIQHLRALKRKIIFGQIFHGEGSLVWKDSWDEVDCHKKNQEKNH